MNKEKYKKVAYVSNNFLIHDTRFLIKLASSEFETHAVSFANHKLSQGEKIEGVYYYEFIDFFPNQYLIRKIPPLWFIVSFLYLKYLFKSIKPDIVHTGYAAVSGFIGSLVNKRPIILMPWGSDILVEPFQSYFRLLILRFTIYRADIICCDCNAVKNNITKLTTFPSKKIVVFPWGIDLKQFNENLSRSKETLGEWYSKKIIICNRNHEEIYGVIDLINSIPKIIENRRDVRFLFLSDGPLSNSLQNRVKELDIEKYVRFEGRVPNENLPQYLRSSDIYMTPSYSDGTSLSLLEAMACGLPIIATSITANREWIVHGLNGFLVKIKSAEEISKYIITLLNDKELLARMSKLNVLVSKMKANWDSNFSKLEKIYRELKIYAE